MHVTVLLTDHCSFSSAALALDVLDAANRFMQQPTAHFQVVTASLDGRSITTHLGRSLSVDMALHEITRTHLVLVPGFLFSLRDAMPSFGGHVPWLRQQHAQGAWMASICTGAFLLAEAGLLDGAKITTHWAFADLLRRRYPQVLVDERHLLCEDRRMISSGGASAAMDLLLHLIRRFASAELAHLCARYLLVDPVRREQSVYVRWSMPRHHCDDAILRVQDWLETHFCEPVNIDQLAARFGFGIRNFKRRFKEATGHTPLAYLQSLRLERAKHLLETTRLALDTITCEVGYEDGNSFRRLFTQRVGLSPAAFRKRFSQPLAN